MVDAKDYPDTVELVAKQYYDNLVYGYLPQFVQDRGFEVKIYDYDSLDENKRKQIKTMIIGVLNTVNYFDCKTCKDCDYFENVTCVTPEGDYSEDPNRRICTNFAPNGLVGTQAGC